jgi:hypothetical protein
MNTDNSDNFQPIHNPYIVGNPIKDKKMFFGREDDFNYIRTKVTGGEKGGLLVLCGSRRSGKTSILFQIMNGRLGKEFFPVLIDMQAMTVENDLDFLIKLGKSIIDSMYDSELSLNRDFLAKREEGSLAAFQNFTSKVTESLHGRKLVLLFDEYEIFESHIAKNLISTEILNLLANWIEHKEGVFIVFTGSDKLEERTAEYWSRFLGKALHRRISFLSRADTFRLIEEPLQDVIQYEEGVVEEIFSLTAGQPFYSQVFCQALVDYLNEVRDYTVTSESLHDVISQIIENPLPQMIFSWNSLGNLEKLTLSVIGELNKEAAKPVRAKDVLSFVKDEGIGYRIDPGALNETLEKLFYHDMLAKSADLETYSFKMDLWRRWMARMHSIWQVADEVKNSEGGLGEGIAVAGKKRSRSIIFMLGTVAVLLALASFIYTSFFGQDGRGNISGANRTISVDSTTVTIRIEPQDADVFLDMRRIEQSPIVNYAVPATATQLRVEREGYKDFVDSLHLQKGVPLERIITLAEKTGHLHISSTPSGAEVFLNDEYMVFGITPVTISDLPINELYEVKLFVEGFNPVTVAALQMHEDSVVSIHRNLYRTTSQGQIASEPDGAQIYVDAKLLGKTPYLYTLTHGPHRFVLELDGYAPKDTTITIPAPDNMISLRLKMLPPGTLIIRVLPFADIYINGEKKKAQTDRYEETLRAGSYTIELRHSHYGTISRIVEVTSNTPTELTIDMTKAGEEQ